jgi:cell division protein FtsB
MKKLKSFYSYALSVLRNRYAATALLALGWVVFISDIDLFFIIEEQVELNKMKDEVKNISIENDKLILQLIELEENPDVLERIARERYFMKKPLEEVYRIVN